MSDSFPDIKTVVVRLITNKPVRKTPYQVKGVFMSQYPDEAVIPMLDGSYRNKFLYPRVQVKILNEQIYIIGIHEGVEPVLSISEKISSLDFGNITFEIENREIEKNNNQFIPSNQLVRYRFITPWVALNHMTNGKYKSLNNDEKYSFLNKLLGQNIVFLANEIGITLKNNIFTKVKVSSLFPNPIDENKWGSFSGDFNTNFILPSYIGIGNGITRGFGSIYVMSNIDSFVFDESELKKNSNNKSLNNLEKLEKLEGLEKISVSDVPKPKRKRRTKSKNKYFGTKKKNNKKKKNVDNSKKWKSKSKRQNKNKKNSKHGNIFSEQYTIEKNYNEDSNNIKDDNQDDQRFNTERHHKKQHKF